jgi:beta-glucosidase
VYLKAGESKTVTIKLNQDAFQFYHPELKKWTFEKGEFEILIGASSKDIKLRKPINL